MFEAKLNESGVLKKVLDAIKDLLSEARFDCSDQGIEMKAIDNSDVCFVSLNLRAEEFETYRCDRSLSLRMHVESLVKMLKYSNNDDSVVIKAQDDSDFISFVFESKNGDRVLEFEMKQMKMEIYYLGIPDFAYDCIVTMPSADFAQIVRDLNQFGENIVISCSKQGVQFSTTGCVGVGTDNVKLARATSIKDADMESIIIDLAEPLQLNFSSKHLTNCTKAAGLSDRVSLSMSKHIPLCIEFKVTEGVIEKKKTDYSYLRYYLAQIEDGEEENAPVGRKRRRIQKEKKNNSTLPVKLTEKPLFMLSSLKKEEKDAFGDFIKELGGSISSSPFFDSECDAMITGALVRSEKILGSIASGKFILKPDYIARSRENGRFLPIDKEFLWHEGNVNCEKEKGLAQASFAWCTVQLKDKSRKPMTGMRFFIDHQVKEKELAYIRLISAAGGEIVDSLENATVFLTENKNLIPIPSNVEVKNAIFLNNLILTLPFSD